MFSCFFFDVWLSIIPRKTILLTTYLLTATISNIADYNRLIISQKKEGSTTPNTQDFKQAFISAFIEHQSKLYWAHDLYRTTYTQAYIYPSIAEKLNMSF